MIVVVSVFEAFVVMVVSTDGTTLLSWISDVFEVARACLCLAKISL